MKWSGFRPGLKCHEHSAALLLADWNTSNMIGVLYFNR